MDNRTLTALRGSIQKWNDILAGTGHDKGCDNCPLCKEFADKTDGESDEDGIECAGCPVRERTGKPGCENSPYTKWARVTFYQDLDDDRCVRLPLDGKIEDAIAAAREERDFLVSLLPEEERAHATG